ncbi:MAG: AAA family ATPase, partial [Anaerolineaceae bacterium]
PYYYHAERAVAGGLARLMQTQQDALEFLTVMDWQKIAGQSSDPAITLTEEQTRAVRMIFSNKVSVLTGGPGTGKSTITGNIIQFVQSFGNTVLLAAPTGRAAKRLSEATGMEALTIHRLLEFSPKNNAFGRNRASPLETDMLIIDETSMVDILLMHSLVDAIREGTHVLFIGDADQLPSVGAGNVLRDLIDSGVIPTIRLTQIFRQSENSYIIQNAHQINQGRMPEFPPDAADFFLFGMEDAQKVEDWIIDIAVNRLPEKFGIMAADIQVLSPMYRGPAGVNALNQRLQNTLNPVQAGKRQHQIGERIYREQDRVMQLRNNYEKLVYNGDIGVILQIDGGDQTVLVNFDNRFVQYDFSELDEIQLAYAISIHKSQGSEFPAVIIPVMKSHYIMLQRNLIYTAITRARRIVVLVGSRKAIAMAINNNQTSRRNTRLAVLLRESSPSV